MPKKIEHLLLVINPGSTSTKLGIFNNETCICEKTLRHSATELERFEKIWDQYEFRKLEILRFLAGQAFDLNSLHAVVGRGGLLKPIESGTYRVDQRMINDLRIGVQGHHAANLGGVLAYGIGWDFNIPSFIVDPPSVDEFEAVSRFSGVADIPRTSLFHALNIKATARKAARDMKKPLEELNLIVAHLGGGITVAALRKGRIIDVNNGLSEGPFTPERAGSVPLLPLIDLCFSGKLEKKAVVRKILGGGGLVSYLNTNNVTEVEALIQAGNTKARMVFEAMAYQVSVEIGARAVALHGKIDGIVLTGGMAHSKRLTELIGERCQFLGTIHRYPGEDELEALALGGLRVLREEEIARVYDAQKKSIGIFFSEHLQEYDRAIQVLEARLRELGYKFRQQDENLDLVVKNCNGSATRMHEAMNEFVSKNVSLIYAIGSPAAAAVKLHLKSLSIPVVCAACFDPVVMGLAESYAGSGNRVAGTGYRVEVREQLEKALLPILPGMRKLGVLYKSGELQSEIQSDEIMAVVKEFNLEVFRFDAQEAADYLVAVEYFVKNKVDAVFLGSDTTSAGVDEATLSTLTSNFPTLCALASNVHKGGLVGRIADWEILCNKSANFALEIMEGAIPASLPIYRNPATKTILNLDTAKTLKLQIPKNFLENGDIAIAHHQLVTNPSIDNSKTKTPKEKTVDG